MAVHIERAEYMDTNQLAKDLSFIKDPVEFAKTFKEWVAMDRAMVDEMNQTFAIAEARENAKSVPTRVIESARKEVSNFQKEDFLLLGFAILATQILTVIINCVMAHRLRKA